MWGVNVWERFSSNVQVMTALLAGRDEQCFGESKTAIVRTSSV